MDFGQGCGLLVTVVFTHECDLGAWVARKVMRSAVKSLVGHHTFRFHCEFHTLCETNLICFHSEITNPASGGRPLS